MNRYIKYFITALFSLTIVALYLNINSCKKIENPNSDKNIKDTITYDLIKTRIFIQYIDANTGNNLQVTDGRELTVAIVGKSGEAVCDIIGLQNDTYYPQNGFLTLALLPEFSPGSSSPITFTIVSKMYNFVTSTKEVSLTREGDYLVKIYMINKEDPPEGVIVERMFTVGNLYNGALHSDVTISTPYNEVSVTIPAGTKLTDVNNVDLQRSLNLTLVYYNINNDRAMSCINGGIAGTTMKNSIRNQAVIFPACVFDLEITDVDMTVAHNIFNKELQIEIIVPEGTYNPRTGADFKINDDIEIYNYKPDTGMWVYNKSMVISDNGSGVLSILSQSSELYSFTFCNTRVNSCSDGSVFSISGDCQDCGSVQIDGVIRKQADDSFVSEVSLAGPRANEINMPFTTAGTPVYINWDQANECNTCIVNPAISPMIIDNMCSPQVQQLPLSSTLPVSYFIDAVITGQCESDTNYVIFPSLGLWVRPVETQCWRWVGMEDGKSLICNIIHGETYIFGTYFNGTWQEWEVIIDEESDYSFKLIFSGADCNEIFGIL